jgi:hypothetical protein
LVRRVSAAQLQRSIVVAINSVVVVIRMKRLSRAFVPVAWWVNVDLDSGVHPWSRGWICNDAILG